MCRCGWVLASRRVCGALGRDEGIDGCVCGGYGRLSFLSFFSLRVGVESEICARLE